MRAPELEIFSDVVRCLSTTLLGGWPLPALADGDALHIARTKGVFCSRGQKTLKNRLDCFLKPVFGCAL